MSWYNQTERGRGGGGGGEVGECEKESDRKRGRGEWERVRSGYLVCGSKQRSLQLIFLNYLIKK